MGYELYGHFLGFFMIFLHVLGNLEDSRKSPRGCFMIFGGVSGWFCLVLESKWSQNMRCSAMHPLLCAAMGNNEVTLCHRVVREAMYVGVLRSCLCLTPVWSRSCIHEFLAMRGRAQAPAQQALHAV